MHYLFNEVLVNALANNRAFQRFAIRSNEAFQEFSKKSTQSQAKYNERVTEFSKTFREVRAPRSAAAGGCLVCCAWLSWVLAWLLSGSPSTARQAVHLESLDWCHSSAFGKLLPGLLRDAGGAAEHPCARPARSSGRAWTTWASRIRGSRGSRPRGSGRRPCWPSSSTRGRPAAGPLPFCAIPSCAAACLVWGSL